MAIIYGLYDPRVEPIRVRYVGYTRHSLEKRLGQHLTEAKAASKNHRHHWLNSLARDGIRPEALILEDGVGENWQDRERFWIEALKDTLVNSTSGGEGLTNPSREVRDILSAKLTGKNIGNQHRKGIPHSEETRRRIGESVKANRGFQEFIETKRGVDPYAGYSAEQRHQKNEALREYRTGRSQGPFSEEARSRMSEAHKGKKLPEASKKKLGSRFINDGKIVKQLKAGEPLPDGWVYGMKLPTGEI